MLIPPKYTLTKEISKLLASIEASKQVIDSLSIPPEVETNIRRQSTLRSSLYSARIEGNRLSLDDVDSLSSKDREKLEVANVLKALGFIYELKAKEVTPNTILQLHKIVMKGLADYDNTGKFRKNMEAIFNAQGIAIYMPPPPRLIESKIKQLVKFINSDKETFIPLRAVLAHYSFEKIHPFLDGSGRVGRLLVQLILHIGGYGMKGILPLEEYLDNNRSTYYRMLEEPEKDVTEYVEFMLTSIAESAKNSVALIMSKEKPVIEDYLLPRRAEILRLIKDHKLINFDQIKRRFAKVNSRTLRFDLKKLQDQELIKKLGTTKGVYYTV